MGVCLAPEESAKRFVERGEEALERRDLLDAKVCFEKALSYFPIAGGIMGSAIDGRRGTRRFVVTPHSKPGTAQGSGGSDSNTTTSSLGDVSDQFVATGPDGNAPTQPNPFQVADSRRESAMESSSAELLVP